MANTEITLIGNDPALAYLISRFAAQSGYQVTVFKSIPTMDEIWAKQPCLVLFSSIDSLASAQALMSELADNEIPVGVCASMSEEAQAHELGADHCLLHPLTYDGFIAIFKDEGPAGIPGVQQGKP